MYTYVRHDELAPERLRPGIELRNDQPPHSKRYHMRRLMSTLRLGIFVTIRSLTTCVSAKALQDLQTH